MSQELRLLAWLPRSGTASRETLCQLAQSSNLFESAVAKRFNPQLWSGGARKSIGGGLWLEDGWELGAVPLSARRFAVGLLPRRLYFEAPQGGTPRWVRESDLFQGRQRPIGQSPALLLRAGCELLRELSEGQEPLDLFRLGRNLTGEIAIRIGGRELPVRDRLAGYCDDYGVDELPEDAQIVLVPEPGVSEGSARPFLEALVRSLRRRKAESAIHVRILSIGELEARLAADSGQSVSSQKRDFGAVWFLLRARGLEPEPRMLDAFRRLDSRRIPWRRAYADDPLGYSVRDQAGSLLQAVGGVAHRVGLRGGKLLPWSLGVDLSHDRGVAPSRLCVTLIDPDGRLTGAWCREQVRDETARTETLRPLLREAATKLRAFDGAEIVLVIRDGRLFENEVPSLYRSELGTKVELLELAKNGVPPLFEELPGGSPMPPRGAVAGFQRDSEWVFLLSGVAQEVGGLESGLKFRRQRGGDSSMFSDQGLAEALVALTYAPGLGSRRSRFPAPIYWADGIAGASDRDLRFRGQGRVDVLP